MSQQFITNEGRYETVEGYRLDLVPDMSSRGKCQITHVPSGRNLYRGMINPTMFVSEGWFRKIPDPPTLGRSEIMDKLEESERQYKTNVVGVEIDHEAQTITFKVDP